MFNSLYREQVLNEVKSSQENIKDEDIVTLITQINKADRIFIIGVGRVLLAMQAFGKRLAHLGFDVSVVGEVTEPAIKKDDLLIVASGSGSTIIPLGIAEKAKSFGAKVVHIGSNPNGPIKEYSDFFVRIPTQSKLKLDDEVTSEQPMTSLFEQSVFLLGDIVCLSIIKEKDINIESLWECHANLE
ncbi:SIS domain-containing protein [Vibrio sp. SA48]